MLHRGIKSACVAVAAATVLFACSAPPPTSTATEKGAGTGNGGDDGTFGDGKNDGNGTTNPDGTCASSVAKTAKGKVDIVFVIDDSGSMDDEMAQIRTNVNTFASKIGSTGLDFTVTFITRKARSATETGNVICVPPPLGGANCGDNPPTFFHVDEDVGSNDSLELILSTLPRWSSHLRPEATKVFVEVTDDESDLPAMSFDSQLLAKPGFGTTTKRNYVFHSIISKPAGTASPSSQKCGTAAGSSLEYQTLSKLTNGIMDEVCKTNYAGVLDNIAKGIVESAGCELGYPSTETSDPNKLVVRVTPASGAAKTLTQVTDPSKCGTVADAWYYDVPAKPTKIILCATTCTSVTSAASTKVEALVGCAGAAPK